MFTRKGSIKHSQQSSSPSGETSLVVSNGGHAIVASDSLTSASIGPTLEADGLVVIGKGSRVQGSIGDCRMLDVQGILEADVTAEFLVVREGGGLKGQVRCVNARIHGVIDGVLAVSGHLDIQATGDVSGEIGYHTLAVQTGAKLRGAVVCSDPTASEQIVGASADIISIHAAPNHSMTENGALRHITTQ